jgi:hypothetical protein
MADNIKIVGNILNIQQVPRYDDADISLLAAQTIQEDFGLTNDYIEYFVYDGAGNILNTTYTYRDFKSPTTSYINPKNNGLPIIEIDPVKDLQNIGYSSGEFKVQYNLFTNKISNSDAELFLKEISADRTELRVGSTILTNEQIESGSLELINEYTNSPYFVDYLLNFGDNTQVVVVNVALNKVESGYEILFKLYQPLPDSIQEKNTLWVVQEKSNPYSFDINLDKLIIQDPGPKLRGPNFNIDIPNQNNVATSYQTYTSLVNSVQNVSTSSYQQLLSLITSQSIDINVDYTDFTNFSFFGSAKQRVINFYDKVKQIEDYNNLIASYIPNVSTTSNLSLEITSSKNAINTIIAQFDGYEQYLYFESSSYTWPKTNTTIPYILATTASAQTWYNALTGSAEIYDDDNQNNLVFTLPSFIKDDEDNDPYITFLNMVGHYFDNIWIFLQAITDINLANNNLEKGVSKDLVYYVLQSLGVKLYNQYGDSDNVSFLVGASGSSNWDNNFTYTGSYLNAIPRKDLLAESYKRIYHNLPLLLKTKGTAYGLETLISTFGISNKDHYTILDANNSASYWYTPTGSAITSSILKVKEYGGDIKSGLLDEFNNDKIRIVSNTITGSVLSPYISLQQQPTSSTQFRTNDLHYVDISFSPQDKIDIFTSASVVANNPTWSLDDFIGDPRFQYNQNYPTLETERTTYLSPLSASVVSYTGSSASGSIGATDYNSFIRLIQFFDNSLFKMLKDYVPARTNLSTGVTISSPILERNKWVFANPSSTSEIEVEDGTISGPSIQTEYTDLYEGINYDNKVAYYDGNLTGSGVNVHNYFVSGNINPYLSNIAVWNAQHPISESIDLNKFAHSDYNVMLNNVSKSLTSRIREDIQFIPGTTQSILSPAELQDSYESLKTHQLSRYDGVKLSSANYNTYTAGDISYGKTATIDKNVSKLGLFSEIIPNKFLPNRNNASLKYLVDIDGNLTELNLRNTHWEEIQNTFIAGDTGSISQFNNQLYSNQKTTDGEKLIYDSGYSYSPLLYFPSCSVSGSNNISFQNQRNQSAYLATAQNQSSSFFVSGSSLLGFPVSGGVGGAVVNIFNSAIDTPSTYFKPGALNSPPTYSALFETGQYKVNASVGMNITMADGNYATWSLEMYKNGNFEASSSQQVYFGNLTSPCFSYNVTNNTSTTYFVISYPLCADGTTQNISLPPSTTIPICSRSFPIIRDNAGDPASPSEVTVLNVPPSCGDYIVSVGTTQNLNFNIDRGTNNSNYISLTAPSDKLTFQLKLIGISNSNYTASLTPGNLSIGSLALSTGYSSINCPFISTASSSSITFTSELSSFYNRGYLFTPNPASGSKSSLYDGTNGYGDVDYTFDPKENDMVVLYLSDNSILEYTISRVSVNSSTNQLSLFFNAELSQTAITNLTGGTYKRFLLLSRQKDETNVILNFIKRDGKSSNGFLIPENISQTVLNNIDIITKEVKQKILGDQPIINDIQGGTFGP